MHYDVDSWRGRPTDELTIALPEALDARNRRVVNAIVMELLRRDAPLGRQWQSLAAVLERNGEHNAAIEAIRRFVHFERGSPLARMAEVSTLQRAGRTVEARELLASLPNDGPDRAHHSYIAGVLDSMLGNVGAAREELALAVRAAPDAGHAWLALAMVDKLPHGAEIGDALIAHDPRRSGNVMRNADSYFYALGKVFADRQQHAMAFEAFSQAAAAAKARQRYDPAAEARLVGRIREGFDRAFIDEVAATVTIDTSRPIFVTGNPRSGTTLVQQILASHSAVADGAELDVLRIVGEEIGGPLEQDLKTYLQRQSADELAALYLHLLDERFGPTGRVVDKRLFASRTLGIIASILPQAPIIWMRRNPVDCAWSCFRTDFNRSSPWSHELETIAQFFKLEDELLTLWQERLGDRILVVPYEELIDDPRHWTRTILAHCGLPEEPAVFAHHNNNRAVMTASVMQVREPINRKGIGAAEPYRAFMQPFIQAYYG